MKRFGIAFLFSTIFVFFLFYVGCDKHPVTTPMPPPTVTPTFTPVLSYIYESTTTGFSPAAITILAGQGVVWTNTGPAAGDLLMDLTGNGVCTGSGQVLGAGGSVTHLFNSAPLTIDYQDIFQSANGGPPCTAQVSAWSGEVFVQ